MSDRLTLAVFAFLSISLLVLTMAWQVPMMLWDHLDLVPIYAAWHDGTFVPSTLLVLHGGHLHALAYAVLLATTGLSHGHPWLDCFVSWLLLLVYAGVVVSFARATFGRDERGIIALIVFLALYPGHLANLQWGWQVAVFLCLAGVVISVRLLTVAEIYTWHVAASILAAIAALLSFAAAAALIPTALVIIALRRDVHWRARVAMTMPWLVLGAFFVFAVRAAAAASDGVAHLGDVPHYVLNFIGAGIARFATDLAPCAALAGLITATWAYCAVREHPESLPWLGLCLFAVFTSVLVAVGRVAPFGEAHAFVTRYISFSSLFWTGWVGLVGMRIANGEFRIAQAGLVLVAVLAGANALHMVKKSYEVGAHANAVETAIRTTYPHVDRAVLDEIYFDEPDVAMGRLDTLHALGFPPFDTPEKRTAK